MSVFELSALSKLRRIGLVRVSNLTDQAIYALGERHSTLERIHLSYCDQISVLAIHFLLQKLPKLTHLSLTGIPAFRRNELQQFCRDPPPVRLSFMSTFLDLTTIHKQEFNTTQRSSFCVYSGKGVSDLRNYLSDLYNAITDDSAQQSGTEYEYETEDNTYRGAYMAHLDIVDDGDEEQDGDDEMDVVPVIHPNGTPAGYQIIRGPQPQPIPVDIQPPAQFVSREYLMSRERGSMPTPRGIPSHMAPAASTPQAGPSRRSRGFGHHPIVEASTSPAPSDAASQRSAGTNHSTGTAFFRHYADAAATATRAAGVITPDLVFAEIGHGRGTGPVPGSNGQHVVVPSNPQPYGSQIAIITNAPTASHMPIIEDDGLRTNGHTPNGHTANGHPVLVDSSYPNLQTPQRTDSSSSWTQIQHDETSQSIPGSPTTRELHDAVHSAFARQNPDMDGRGRTVKRSLRNTFNAAEQYASSFLFGRGSSMTVNEGPSSPAQQQQQQQNHRRDSDQHGH